MLLLEYNGKSDNQLMYDVFKPVNKLWWSNEQEVVRLEQLYSVSLINGNIQQVIKYHEDGKNSIGSCF